MSMHPYPGLRPFTREETFIFFGRESHTHELVRILGRTRFLAVTGNSGSGKSSIVRTGLLDALDGGLLSEAGSDWRLADLRPGDAPVDRLAEGLLDALGFERFEGDVPLTAAMLARGPGSVAELMRQARISVDAPLPEDANLLILVDQFEELFRFADHGGLEQAEHFINLLLASASQRALPIYVVITMRSDYLGDCGRFEGLAEAINRGQFLTPRMTREQAISAIEGPAEVFGAEVDPRLVNELVNDMGVRQDRLPLLQHVLNLLWSRASKGKPEGEVVEIRLEDYRAFGGLEDALDTHAEEIYGKLDERQKAIAEVLFRQLVEARGRGIDNRRPTRADEILAISGCSLAELTAIVEAFRGPGRSFLMPPVGTEIAPATVIDLSHESLIRGWKQLGRWTERERQAADQFRSYLGRSADYRAGRGALLTDAELVAALEWRRKVQPTAAWAARYGEGPSDLEQVLDYIQESHRRRRRQRTQVYAAVAAVLILVTTAVSWILVSEAEQAEIEAVNAELQAKQEELETANSELADNQAELERANDDLEANQAELREAIDELEAKRAELERKGKELEGSQAQLQRLLEETEQLKEAAERAQDDILHEYQRYLAGAARDARLFGDDALRRRLLALAWPNWLESVAENRIPEEALDGMPDAYAIELLLSEMSLGEVQSGKAKFPVGSTEMTHEFQMTAVDETGRWMAAVVDGFGTLLLVDFEHAVAESFGSGGGFDAVIPWGSGFLLAATGEGIVALDTTAPSLSPGDLWNQRELVVPSDQASGILVDAENGRLITHVGGGLEIFSWPYDDRPSDRIEFSPATDLPPLPAGSLWTADISEEDIFREVAYGSHLALIDNGRLLITRSDEGELWLWDLAQGRWAARTPFGGVRHFGISDDERHIVLADSDKEPNHFQIYRLSDGAFVASVDAAVWLEEIDLEWTMDFEVSGSGDRLRLQLLEAYGLWDIDVLVRAGEVDVNAEILRSDSDLLLGRIGARYAVALKDWDDDGFELGSVVPFGQAGEPLAAESGLALAPDGGRVVEVSTDRLAFSRLVEGKDGSGFRLTTESALPACLDGAIRSLSLARGEGPLVALVEPAEETDSSRLCLFWERDGAIEGGEAAMGDRLIDLRQLALSPDGRKLAMLAQSELSLWSLQRPTGKEQRPLDCHEKEAEVVRIEPWTATLDCTHESQEYDLQALALGPNGATLAALSYDAVWTWEKNFTSEDQIPLPEPYFGDLETFGLTLSPEGGLVLTRMGSEVLLVDLCHDRIAHRFAATGEATAAGFMGDGETGCDGDGRKGTVWLRDDQGLIAYWQLRSGERSQRLEVDFVGFQGVDPFSLSLPFGENGDVAVAGETLSVERPAIATVPESAEGQRSLVDLLLLTMPLAEQELLDLSVFVLPAGATKGGGAQERMAGESLPAACLRLGELAFVAGSAVGTREAEQVCQMAIDEGPVVPAVATLYARLQLEANAHDLAEDVLLLAAAAGDRGALWTLAGHASDYDASDLGYRLFGAIAESDVLVRWHSEFEAYEDAFGTLWQGLWTEAEHGLSDEALLERAAAGDPFAMVALGQGHFVAWQANAQPASAIEGFRHFVRASLAANSLPKSYSFDLRARLDEVRVELAIALRDHRQPLAQAWHDALVEHAETRHLISQPAEGVTTVTIPGDAAERHAAALAAAGKLAGDPDLGDTFQDLWLKKMLESPVPEDQGEAAASFAQLAAMLQRDDPTFLLADVTLPKTLARLLRDLSDAADARDGAAKAQDILGERLRTWMQSSLSEPPQWTADGSYEERVFWCFALEVQRGALALGRIDSLKHDMPTLLRWVQNSIYVPEDFEPCPGDSLKPVDETRLLTAASRDAELALMGDALAFALGAWHANADPAGFDKQRLWTESLAARLRDYDGPDRRIAEMLSWRTFGDNEDPAPYYPVWPENDEDQGETASEIAYVIAWAAERVESAMLLESLGNVRSWEAHFLENRGAESLIDASAARLASGDAYLEAALLGGGTDQLLNWASQEYVSAIDDGILASDPDAVERGFQAIGDLIERLQPGSEVWQEALADLYDTWIGTYTELPIASYLSYLERTDRMARAGGDWYGFTRMTYNRRVALIHLLSQAGWEAGILPGILGGAPPDQCDDMASYLFDPLRRAPEVHFVLVDPLAVDACALARETYPDERRFLFLQGRALLAESEKSGDLSLQNEALELYREAAEAGYPGAIASLAVQFVLEEQTELAADFAEAGLEATLVHLAEPVGRVLLASDDDQARMATADLLRLATELGVAPAAALLAEALAEGRVTQEDPGEGYRQALIAAELYKASGDGGGEIAARGLAIRLAGTLEEAERRAAEAAATAFETREPHRPDYDAVDFLILSEDSM